MGFWKIIIDFAFLWKFNHGNPTHEILHTKLKNLIKVWSLFHEVNLIMLNYLTIKIEKIWSAIEYLDEIK